MTTNAVERPAQILSVLNELLDRDFDRVMRPVLRATLATLNSGALNAALEQIERTPMPGAMADRRALFAPLLAEVQQALARQTTILTRAADSLQRSGIDAAAATTRRLAITGMGGVLRAQIEAAWNVPDPEALAAAVQFTGDDAWREEIERYQQAGYDAARSTVLAGILAGQGPMEIARTLRQQLRSVTGYQANTMARTLQLVSYREATRLHQIENARLADGIIRIAALDDRTCLCCIALHGTEYPVGTRIDDHHAGRCLPPGQRVLTARGMVRIEDVRVGDLVYTHRGRLRPVLRTFSRQYAGELLQVSDGYQTVTVTPEHALLTQRGWVEAQRLTASDILRTLNPSLARASSRMISQPASVSLASRTFLGTVYDLEVEEDHSFIAEGIVVHNCTSILKVRGHGLRVQTGEAWFASLPDVTRERIAGPAAYNALQAGVVRLKDFVGEYQDPVYGRMLREQSLRGILGDTRARGYYGRRGSSSRSAEVAAARRGIPPPVVTLPPPLPARRRGPATPAAAPAAPTATDVSRALSIGARGHWRQVIRGALEIIDKVHTDGVLPKARWGAKEADDRFAAYYEQNSEYFAFGSQIDIVRNAGHLGRGTVMHEIGHFIDYHAMGRGRGYGSDNASGNPAHPMAAWWDAVVRSDNYKFIVSQRWFDDYYRYAMQPTELWARSYAQYVGLRSGDPAMQAEMAFYRSKTKVQWDDADFAPIATAIDALFSSMGWLR